MTVGTTANPTTALRFVVRRAVADRSLLAPAWLLVLAATALLATSALHADVARRDGLRRALVATPASELAVTVTAQVPAPAIRGDLDTGRDRLAAALAGSGAVVATVVRSDSYALPNQETVRDLTLFSDVDALGGATLLVAGRMPEPGRTPVEVVVTEPAARALGITTGETLTLTSRRDNAEMGIRVVGMVAAPGADTPAAIAEPLLATGAASGTTFRTIGPLLATREDLLGRVLAGSAAVSWSAVPQAADIGPGELQVVAARVSGLESSLRGALGSSVTVRTDLPATLRRLEVSLLAGGAGILLLDVQLAVLAGYGLLLIATLLLEERRSETALFRSRGANGLALTRWALLEALLLVVSAASLGLLLALAVVAAGPRLGILGDAATPLPQLDGTAILVTLAAAAAALAGFLLPTVASLGPLVAARRAIGRQGPRTGVQRAGLDLALLALAAIGLWQLHEYGAPITRDLRGTLGVDPLLVAAPAIALLAGALLGLRIVPLVATLAERLVGSARGLLLPLGARQLARRPARYSRTALLLVMAAAISVFAGAYGGTWSRSQSDQVDQEVGADLAIRVADPRTEPWVVDAQVGGAAGIRGRTPVRDEAFDLGPAGRGTLLAIRPEDASTIRLRDDRADRPVPGLFAGLVAARPAAGGVPLPDGTARLRIALRTDLAGRVTDEQSVPLDLRYPGAWVTAVVRDARGFVTRYASPRTSLETGARSLVVDLSSETPTGARVLPAAPLELLAVEIGVQLPDGTAAVGTLEVSDIATTPDAGPGPDAGAWTALADAPIARWDAATRQLADADPAPFAVARPGRVAVGGEAPIVGPAVERFALRAPGLGAVAPLSVPALADPRLETAFGAGPGDTVGVSEQFADMRRLAIVDTLRGFPTIPRGRPFAVVDLPTLALSDYLAHGRTLGAGTWWAALGETADPAAVSEALAAGPIPVEVTSRAALLADRLADPVTGAVVAALALASAAALVFATIGFLVTAAIGARERLPDLAVLRALGVRGGRLWAWLTAEQAILLAVGLALGAGLGAVLAWVVLPTVTLGPTEQAVDPPARIVLPPESALVLVGLALLLLAAAALLVRRTVARCDVAAVLRAADR